MEMATASPPKSVPGKWRRLLIWLGALAAIAIAVPLGLRAITGWLEQRELDALYAEIDADDPNWRYADLAKDYPDPPPDEQNAAVRIMRVHNLLKKTGFALAAAKAKGGPTNPNGRLPANQSAALRAAFAKLGPVPDEARQLKDLPEGRFRFEPSEGAVRNPNGPFVDARLLRIFDLLKCDAALRADDGEIEEAAESCQALVHAVHAINDYPDLTAQLIRSAGQHMAIDAIERTLGQGEISEDRLAALQRALEREAQHNRIYAALRGARAERHALQEKLDSGMSLSELYGRSGPSLGGRLREIFLADLGGYAERLRLYHDAVQASRLPEEARLAALEAAQEKAVRRPDPVEGYVLACVINYAAEMMIAQGRLRCAAMAIAAERYRLKQRRWPENADELVRAGLLEKPFRGPFDGQPLRWKATPTGIIVYTVGMDKADHGGKISRGGPASTANVGFELWWPALRGR